MKKFTFFLCAVILSVIGYAQGVETFSNLENASGDGNGYSNSYQKWTWIGDNGTQWEATDARKDETIDGKAITIRNGSLTTTISGGIGNLTLTTQRKYGNGSGNLTVLANGNAVGTFAYGTSEQTNTIAGINLSGDVALEIQTPGNGDRVAMDNLIWTAFSSSEFDCPSLQANVGESCDDGNPLTNNDSINEDCECVGIPVDIGDQCGFENFDNAELTTNSYSDGSFVGNNNITWTYVEARDENGDTNNSGIDGKAIMLRRASDNSKIISSTISGGIKSFSVKLYKGFTGSGDRQVELFINGVSHGSSTPFDDYNEHIFTVDDIDLAGDFTIEIRNITGKQVIIDNISWSCFEDEGGETYDCLDLQANIGDSCDDGDDTTENDVVTEDCECAGSPIIVEPEFDCPSLQANIGDSCDDGDDTTENDVVTDDCECVGTPIEVGEQCGFENFDNTEITASYSDGSFVGNDNITWTYVESRDENGDANNSGIDGKAIMLRRASDNSKIVSSTISGGIKSFSVKLYKGFTGSGNRQVELFINGVSHGSSTPFNDYDEHIFTVGDIDLAGDFTIEIRNITSRQVIIDDISWTCFEDEGGETYDCLDLQANIGDSCDDGDDTTENDVVTEDCECAGTPIIVEPEFDCPSLQANIGDSCDDGDDSTENDVVNEDCECMGTPIIVEPEFDCPSLQANFGDSCDDGDDTTENDIITEDCECMGTPIVDPDECVAPTEVSIERLSPTSIAISTNVEVWSMYVDIFNNPPSFNSRTKSHWTKLRNTYVNNNVVPNRTYYLWFRTNCPNNELSEYTELYTVEPWSVARGSSNPNATINQIHEQLVNVDVFPNPTSDELNISGINAQQIRIFDSNGTAIFNGRVNNNQLNLRQLQTGVYRLVITDENNREHTVQVIKR